jgi:hypothetical protein
MSIAKSVRATTHNSVLPHRHDRSKETMMGDGRDRVCTVLLFAHRWLLNSAATR